MPIKNYTTQIDPAKTAGEITRILARFKAKRIQHEFDDDGDLAALSFSIVIDGVEVAYRLPARPEGVLAALRKEAQPRYRNLNHAKRVAWRIVKDWIDAQLAIIEAGAALAHEVFLPYMLVGTDEKGRAETLVERIERAGGAPALQGNVAGLLGGD